MERRPIKNADHDVIEVAKVEGEGDVSVPFGSLRYGVDSGESDSLAGVQCQGNQASA
jgi:hypothetical protein